MKIELELTEQEIKFTCACITLGMGVMSMDKTAIYLGSNLVKKTGDNLSDPHEYNKSVDPFFNALKSFKETE